MKNFKDAKFDTLNALQTLGIYQPINLINVSCDGGFTSRIYYQENEKPALPATRYGDFTKSVPLSNKPNRPDKYKKKNPLDALSILGRTMFAQGSFASLDRKMIRSLREIENSADAERIDDLQRKLGSDSEILDSWERYKARNPVNREVNLEFLREKLKGYTLRPFLTSVELKMELTEPEIQAKSLDGSLQKLIKWTAALTEDFKRLSLKAGYSDAGSLQSINIVNVGALLMQVRNHLVKAQQSYRSDAFLRKDFCMNQEEDVKENIRRLKTAVFTFGKGILDSVPVSEEESEAFMALSFIALQSDLIMKRYAALLALKGNKPEATYVTKKDFKLT